MSDCIARDALLKDIEESVVFSGQTPNAEIVGANKVISRIKSAPIADVEPVIRCKDCEHSKELLDYDERNLYCLVWGREFPKVLPDDFCSHGERKTNGLK